MILPSVQGTVKAASVLRLAGATASAVLRVPFIHQRSLYQNYRRPQQAAIGDADRSGSIDANGHGHHSLITSNAFDPPAQISKINTHYCREPQLVMIEGFGILQGQMDPSRLLTKYLNIPFATIQDKSRQAVKPEPWKGIRDATVLGPMCPQDIQSSNSLTTMMLGLPGPGFEFSERDCLNLNVFAPRFAEHVPVICYIHGGITSGGNALPKNDATNIVKKSIAKDMPVVVVTINYRLLPSAGLLESPDSKSENGKTSENVDWGLYDQKLALEWVKKHIHNFGGNPNEITLMGHSSGASSAGYHLLNGRHEGLVKRAIMHSESRRRENEEENSSVSVPSERDYQQWKPQDQRGLAIHRRVEKDNVQFSFMSDACIPYMSNAERQAGFRVVDRWIDFAWGME